MAFRRTGRPTVRARSRRQTTWEGFTLDIPTVSVGNPVMGIILTEAQIENFGRPTLMRIRGSLMVSANVASRTLNLLRKA